MKWLRFILSHSIFISFCAVALCFQTQVLLHLQQDVQLYAFVFFCTLSSYNFYWLVSKYAFRRVGLRAFVRQNISYLILFFIAGAGAALTLYPERIFIIHVAVAAGLTALYSLPLWPFTFTRPARRAGILKPVTLAFTWTYVTVIFPAAGFHPPFGKPLLALFAARFCFMLLLCIIFDARDASVDRIHDLHSLSTDVSRSTLRFIIVVVFMLYLVAGFTVRLYFHDPAQEVAFAFTGLATLGMYYLSCQPRAYLFYYFGIDGLMLLSALASYAAAFYTNYLA